MKKLIGNAKRHRGLVLGCATLLGASCVGAADWPQWLGPDRDGKVSGFTEPKAWPEQLTKGWSATVGMGDATPALVGDKLYVFAKQDADEVTICLDAGSGKVVWQDKYPADATVERMAAEHSGTRSSPAVADGKVVTLGLGGIVTCLDASTGKVVWRKDSVKDFSLGVPPFSTAASPLILDKMCIVPLGGSPRGGGGKGAVMAFDLGTGETKWKWDGEAPTYSSPVVMTFDDGKQIVQLTEKSVVGLSVADGKLLWQTAFGGMGGRGMGGGRRGFGGGGFGGGAGGPGGPASRPEGAPGAGPGGPRGPDGPGGGGMRGMRGMRGGGGGMSYNAPTPVIDGQTVILTGGGQGTKAFKIEKQGDAYAAKELWTDADDSAPFNTPVLKDGKLFGISAGSNLFCVDAKSGKRLWADTTSRGQRGFGTLVDAGPVLFALGSDGALTVFKPDDKAYSQVAELRAPDSKTYAYPVISGSKIFIKDQYNVTLYTLE